MLFPVVRSFLMLNFTPFLFSSLFKPLKSRSFSSNVSTFPFFTKSFTVVGFFSSINSFRLLPFLAAIFNIFFIRSITIFADLMFPLSTTAITCLLTSSLINSSPPSFITRKKVVRCYSNHLFTGFF